MILNSNATDYDDKVHMIDGTSFLVLSYSDVQNKIINWNYPIDKIKELAKDATRVAIYDEEGNYVVSIPETYPIQRMRIGKSLNHDNSNNYAGVLNEWTASDSKLLNKLTHGCSKTFESENLKDQVFQAGCNNKGLHLQDDKNEASNGIHVFRSMWDFQSDMIKLYLAIDYNVNLINTVVGETVIPETDWLAKCYQNRSTNLSEANLPNCIITADFGTTQECFKCEEGYTYDEKYNCITLADAETQGICTSLNGNAIGTDECSYCDYGKDNQCGEGEVLVDQNKCAPQIINCENYDCDGNCLECLNGTFIAQDANVCVEAIDHCNTYDKQGACLSCKSSYVEVKDDLCCPTITNCTVYGDTCGQCDQICQDGHVESHETQQCVPIIPYCANYWDSGECNYCDSGYAVAVDYKRVCVKTLPHCNTHNSDESCNTCNAGYVEVTNQIDSSQSKCIKAIDECKNYTYSNGDCIQCDSQKTVPIDDPKKCVPEISDCLYHTKDYTCEQCETDFLPLDDSTCISKVNKCLKYECSGECQECNEKYTLVNNNCVDSIEWCYTYKDDGSCETCQTGYTLGSNATSCYDINHCLSFDCNDTCIECMDGYKHNNDGICFKVD